MATAASIAEVQKAYVAYYGRPADPAGLEYWATRVDAEGGIDALVGEFGNSAEAVSRFGSLSQGDAIEAIYQQIFNRAADTSGKTFYLEGLLSGEFTLVTLARDIIGGATGSDVSLVSNKLTAAQSFTDALDTSEEQALYSGNNAAGNARNWLKTVDGTEASVTGALSLIDTTIQALQGTPSNPGNTYSLTTLTAGDSLQGTSNDDTYDATTTGSLQTADVILDASTTDNDTLTAIVTTTTAAPKLTNVENIVIQAKVLTAGLALTNVTGAKTVTVSSTVADGVGTLTDVNSLVATTYVAGSNLDDLNLTSLSSGTRDYVEVDLSRNGVSGVITGSDSGADFYSVSMGSGSTVRFETVGTNDGVRLSNVDTSAVAFQGSSALSTLTINGSGDLTIRAGVGLASGVIVNGSGTTTIDFTGNGALLDELVLSNTGAGSVSLDIGNPTASNAATANVLDLSNAAADEIVISAVSATGAAVELLLHSDSSLVIQGNTNTAFTVSKGSGSQADGYAELNLILDASIGGTSARGVGSVTIGSSISGLIMSSTTGATVTIDRLVVMGSATDSILLTGANAITISGLDTDGAGTVLVATDMTGALSVSSDEALLGYFGAGNDTITIDATATISAGAGNDTINLGDATNVVDAGAGDDTVVNGASASTITLGDGSDIYRITIQTGSARDTITDFVTGTDRIQVLGGTSFDAGNMSVSSSVYQLGGEASVTLTGVTATDLTDSIQLGQRLATPYDLDLAAATASVVVAGDYGDFIQVGVTVSATVTLGDGADTLLLHIEDGSDYDSTHTVSRVNDFTVGTDTLVLAGSIAIGGGLADSGVFNFDSYSASPSLNVSTGVLTFGASAAVMLRDGSTGLATTNLSDSIQFGWSGSQNNFLAVGSSTLTLGTLSDNIAVYATSTITIRDTESVDLFWSAVALAQAASTVMVNFGLLDGIDSTVTTLAANASKVSDAVSGVTYIFASGEDGAGSSALDFSGSTQVSAGAVSLADVATFLAANLGTSDGEKYVAVINDASGTQAAAFYVAVSGDLDSDDITLIAMFDYELGASNTGHVVIQNI